MELRYLLDTNFLSDLARQPQGIIAQRIASMGEDTICTSIIVASELRFGAQKKGSPRLAHRIDEFLSVVSILPLEAPDDYHYAHIRCQLERAGTPIGPNDMFIAAQALARDLTVVTVNTNGFKRVHGLTVENWLYY
nr:type II toxin-antitoxin system VapC family toxin [uncultured Halomonas sp.]